jgi:glyceraldehyde-3-phosphate dehydrogenase/erythrose-4-phosphate dehydrogenase
MLRKLHVQAGASKRVVCGDMRLDQAAHLLKFDSIYGVYPGSIDIDDRHLIVDGCAINFVHDTGDGALSAARQADIVIDTRCTFHTQHTVTATTVRTTS